MGATSESRLRANKKYLDKFIDMKIRVLPDEHDVILKHAKEAGDASTAAFIRRAINETIDRDLESGKVTEDFRKR